MNLIDRKKFIALILLFFSEGMSVALYSQGFVNPLFIPDTVSGSVINLTMAQGSMNFLPGDSTRTYGINGNYLGPTIMLNKWDSVQMNVTNLLSDTSTMHWHGMHVAPEDDGGPHTMIPPGDTWSPDFQIYDEAATYWYHPHLHSKTAEQVYWGAAGMIIVHDDHEDSLGLPSTYGVDDFPLIIQDKTFDSLTNQFVYAALNDTVMVNGTLSPYLEVPAQMVRFRFLNGSNQRSYLLTFNGGRDPLMIGSDGGLLRQPMPADRLLLAPGERIEIVVDFSNQQGNNFILSANNSEMADGISGAPVGPGGGPGNPLDGSNFPVIEFRVVAPTSNPVTSIPNNLNTFTVWNETDASIVRTKIFDGNSGGPYYINTTPFNMSTINDTVWLDDIEVWELINNTEVAHPFHIHDIQFYVLELNGQAPPPQLAGRKDVFLALPGDTMRFITKFENWTNNSIPYMYHCHNLFHEDAGMMGQFLVMDPLTQIDKISESEGENVSIFPNPFTGSFQVQLDDESKEKMDNIEIVGIDGKIVKSMELIGRSIEIDMRGMSKGLYFIQINYQSGKRELLKIIKQ